MGNTPTFFILLLLLPSTFTSCDHLGKQLGFNNYEWGDRVDSLHGVYVYYNGPVGNVKGRNLAADGYNIGLKYQCVEFVKRYYYDYLNHKMPDSYGHAKDFFDSGIRDGQLNKRRALIQFRNLSKQKPQVDDLIIFDGTSSNKYGHVAIISMVSDNEIEIIQQNPGKYGPSRETFPLKKSNGLWKVKSDKALGWLRKI